MTDRFPWEFKRAVSGSAHQGQIREIRGHSADMRARARCPLFDRLRSLRHTDPTHDTVLGSRVPATVVQGTSADWMKRLNASA